QAEDGIRDFHVTGVQTCALPISVMGSKVYAGGDFTTVGGNVTKNRITALDISTGSVTSWNPNANGTVRALVVSGSTIYVAGSFKIGRASCRERVQSLGAAGVRSK